MQSAVVVVGAVAGQFDVGPVDGPHLLRAKLTVDENLVGGHSERPEGVEAGHGHGGAPAQHDLQETQVWGNFEFSFE